MNGLTGELALFSMIDLMGIKLEGMGCWTTAGMVWWMGG